MRDPGLLGAVAPEGEEGKKTVSTMATDHPNMGTSLCRATAGYIRQLTAGQEIPCL